MTAFKQVLTNLQAGQREEAMIGLEFVLRLDPSFTPAANLKRQLASSSNEIDLGDIIAQLQAPTTEAINCLLIEAVEDFNSREFLGAREKVEKVLIDLPGHQEARDLRDQIDKALKIEGQVGQFLIQAREALAKGDPQEAANFVMMAQALDPHHTGIASTLKEIDDTGGLALSQEASAESSQETTPPTRHATMGAEMEAVAVTPAPEQDAPPSQPADQSEPPKQDAFAVEFDTQDPFADLIDAAPEAPTSEPIPEFGAGDEVSFPPMDDTADLFTAPRESSGTGDPAISPVGAGTDGKDLGSDDGGERDEDSIASSIQDLIEQGRAAMDRRDQPLAISLWSRVFLLKPAHPEAGHLIERAKKSLSETETEVEDLLGKARDAFDEREFDAAQLLITKALARRPNHLEVYLLKEELDREQGVSDTQQPVGGAPTEESSTPSGEPAPGVPELPELDDDLFGDVTDVATTEVPSEESEGTGDDLFDDHDLDFDDFNDLTLIDRLRSMQTVRMMAIAGVALIVVLTSVWLGGKFLSTEPEVDESVAVNEVLLQADRLYKEHKAEEALHLLREFPAAGLSQQRIDMRIGKYEDSLAPPTPTPVPEHASRAEALLDQGLWWSAYVATSEGLVLHPDDSGLIEIHQSIIDTEPEAPILENALRTHDYRTAVSISEDLLLQYPGQGDIMVILERSLFNAALAESRAYNLTGAENHLARLLELKPEDEEAIRFLEFVQTYKVRAADMRLEIFIRSMNER